MGDINYTKSLIFISIFAIAIIGYAVGFASDNNAVISIDPDAELSTLNSAISGNLTEFQIDTNSSSTSFFQSFITGQEQTTVTGGEFKLNLFSLVDMIKSIFKSINKNIFGGNPAFGLILTVFGSFLIYMGIRYIWKTWKGGNPD